MKSLLPIFAFLLLLHSTPSSAQQQTFNKRMHLGFPSTVFTSIIATDSCYYVTGIITDSVPPYNDASIFIKFTLDGEPELVKALRDTVVSYSTWAPVLQGISEGNLLLSGQSRDSTTKAILIKYNTLGDTLFTRRYENYGQDGLFIKLKAMAVDEAQSQYLLATEEVESESLNDADVVMTKIGENGEILWRKRLTSNNLNEIPHSAISWQDGSFIIGAQFNNTIVADFNYTCRDYLFAVDSAGNIEWQYLSPAGELRRGATALSPAGDGGLVVASGRGEEFNINPSRNGLRWHSGLVYKLDAQQQLEWEVEFIEPLPNSFYNRFNKIIRASDGSGYLAAGLFVQGIPESLEADLSGWLVKVSPDGDSLWSRALRFFEPQDPYYWHHLYDIKETADGGYIMVGQ
ncbi:MAG: hypothetical protein KDD02_27025, partial [Phaeodactylibacter sp.]|nr:hypothetical protein [Phaeodactylibacter sp.]